MRSGTFARMKALLVLLSLAGAAHADSMFATDHDGTLAVYQIAGDTLTTAYEEPSSGVLEYGWSDAHTLWALRAQKGVFSIEKIVDGKPQKPRVLTHADWKPAEGKPSTEPPHLMITTAGAVWLQRCPALVHDEKTKRDQCLVRHLRVDADAEIADKPPADLRSDEVAIPETASVNAPQKVRGPKGYMFAVTRKGFTCTAPKHNLVFPAGTRWIAYAYWVNDAPAIVRFSVNKYDDYGGGIDANPEAFDGTGEFLLDDCKTYLTDIKKIEPGVVATTEGKSAWKVRRGATVLGTFTAKHVEVMPY